MPSWGLSRVKEGVALMEKDTHHRRNFILRGKDNYANALRKAGRLDEADSQAAEAAKLRGEDKTDQ